MDLDTTYLLDFVKDKSKKYSYASSIAMREIPLKYKEKYKKNWEQFNLISCREKQGSTLISELTDRYSETVLDPVFLLSSEKWKEISEISQYRRQYDEYILVYTLNTGSKLVEKAQNISKLLNKPLIVLLGDIEKNKAVGPIEWLNLFNNADIVFTDSFHGTAFSIIFNKQFWVEISQDKFFADSSSRINDLLSEIKCEDRLIDRENYLSLTEIDYKMVNPIIERKISESYQYLDKIIN